jgi:NitT/TauT family transport system substrate-binding protein
MRPLLAVVLSCLAAPFAQAETTIRVGWCASTMSAAASPYAVAQKMGWFGARGVRVVVTLLPGSTDCVKQVATCRSRCRRSSRC